MRAASAVAATDSRPGSAELAAPARGHGLALNFFLLSGGELTAKLLTFAAFGYLARLYGPRNYGFIEFTVAVMVFFTLPADLGLGSYGAREIARDPAAAPQLLRIVTGLRMALALCSMATLAVFVACLHGNWELKVLIGMYGVSLLGGPFLLQWFFQGHDRMHWVSIASIVRQGTFAALVFFFCRPGAAIVRVGVIECVSVAAVAAYSIYIVRGMGFAWPVPDLRLGQLRMHLREAAPIGLAEIAWAFMWYFCTVLLGLVFSDATLGWFGASHRILMALHTFVWLYFFNLLPSISRTAGRPRQELLELMDSSMRLVSWAGLFGAALLCAIAPDALTLMYGPYFRSAGPSFSILVWMLPVAMLSGHHRYTLIAYGRQQQLLNATIVSAAVAVALGFALVPAYGGIGAAWALLIANVVNFALVYVAVRNRIATIPIVSPLAAPLGALVVSAGVYLALARWDVRLAIVAATAVYMAALAYVDGARILLFLRAMIAPRWKTA